MKTRIHPTGNHAWTWFPLLIFVAAVIATTAALMPSPALAQSSDATLSALTVSPKDINGFQSDRRSYEVGVASTVTQATVTATTSHSGATVIYTGTDADPIANGHQVDLSAGRNQVGIAVTAEDGSISGYVVNINQGVDTDYGWNADKDLDPLIAAGQGFPRGIWSDGTTMWVSDTNEDKIFAYTLATGARDATKEFNTLVAAGNDFPSGIWSDDTTMWVADRRDDKIYAYNMSTKARDADKDFETLIAAGNTGPTGIWSDGTTMWVADQEAPTKVFAYKLSDKERVIGQEINLGFTPEGITGDDDTIWISDTDNVTIYAYSKATRARTNRQFTTVMAAGNEHPTGLWTDGGTMYVVDSSDQKVYAYNMPPPLSDAAKLSALTVTPKNINGFDAGREYYEVGVASTVTRATVTATKKHEGASVNYSGTDADTIAEGHQVDLSAGRNLVSVIVTADDGFTTQTYTVNINRAVTDRYGWKADDDFDTLIAQGNANPTGIWSDGTTTWVADPTDDQIYAYTLETKAHDSTKSIASLLADNENPVSLWSDGTDWVWVIDDGNSDDWIYRYPLNDGSAYRFRRLPADNGSPSGLWSDGDNYWVSDRADGKIYAYSSDGARQHSDDFDTLAAAGNNSPTAIWSDGTTMWVADGDDDKIYAYDLDSKDRAQFRDFDTLAAAGNVDPQGIWANDAVMYVTDADDGKVYAYNMPGSNDSTLSALTVSPKSINGFASDRFFYEVGVASTVETATISATANHSGASVAITPDDSDTVAEGHQVDLSAGRNPVTVTVTAEDGGTGIYIVSINRGVDTPYGWNADKDFDTLVAQGISLNSGIWSDGSTMWMAALGEGIHAYNLATKAPDSARSITPLHADNQKPLTLWGDDTNLWVVEFGADSTESAIYRYTLTDGTILGPLFNPASDNDDPRGIWSDGTTVWVADIVESKIYAYSTTGTRKSSEDFDTLAAAGNNAPFGIWSDGDTMWVSDGDDTRIYAYDMDTKARTPTRDFTTLAAAGNETPGDLWSDGETMYVNDPDLHKIYAYNMPPSADTSLSTLTVNDIEVDQGDLLAFPSTSNSVTLVATPTHADATVSKITPNDADTFIDDHQLALTAGEFTDVEVTVTAADTTITGTTTFQVYRGDLATPFAWRVDDDVTSLSNSDRFGLAHHDNTLWVANHSTDTLRAYVDGSRDSSKDVTLHSSNEFPGDMWTDGTYVWVLDEVALRIYVYQLDDSARQTSREFNLASENRDPRGIYSDGTSVFVTDIEDDKVYVYNLSDGSRGTAQTGMEFDLDPANGDARGIWADATTVWISNSSLSGTGSKIFAYAKSDGSRDARRDFNTLANTGNRHAGALISNGSIMWVHDRADFRIYSYNMAPSVDATLSALTVSPKDINGFQAGRTSYEVGVASTVTRATVTATANHEGASFSYTGTDADTFAEGHQVDLSAGRNLVSAIVTAEDEFTSEIYRVSINRAVTDDYGWKAEDDFDTLIAQGNEAVSGIWSDGTTMWVADHADEQIYAYDLSTKAYDSAKSITTLHANNQNPGALWGDETHLWVLEDGTTVDGIYRYTLADGTSQGLAFSLHADNGSPRGLWSDGTTFWVADHVDGKIYAYHSNGDRWIEQDFDALMAAGNESPSAIWSDGATMRVADDNTGKIYAYHMVTKARIPALDFDTLQGAGNLFPQGLWSSDTVMYVSDIDSGKVFAYNRPNSDVSLSTLTVSDADVSEGDLFPFPSATNSVTVVATPTNADATVKITPDDAEIGTDDHQLALTAGVYTTVAVTVTAADGGTTRTTTFRVYRGDLTTPFAWRVDDDLTSQSVGDRWGITHQGNTLWLGNRGTDSLRAFTDDSRDAGNDVALHADNADPVDIWANDTYVWVLDSDDDHVYVYQLNDDARQTSREFTLHADNANPTGIFSDGTSVFITDTLDDKVYVYNLSDGARGTAQTDMEFSLHADNGEPRGIWADGNTVWVSNNNADETGSKIFAYDKSDGARQPARDFNTLEATGNTFATTMTSDGTTMWVVDLESSPSRVYSYNKPPEISIDATLSNLTLSPKNFLGFNAERTSYTVGVAHDVETATVAATTNDDGATVVIKPDDADTFTTGHQVDLQRYGNDITVTVTAEDTVTTMTYRIKVNRGSDQPYEWKASEDLEDIKPAQDSSNARGITRQGGTTWIAPSGSSEIRAYNSAGARDNSRDITAAHSNPGTMWNDGTTVWISDYRNDNHTITAYLLSDGSRQSSKDVTPHTDNGWQTGIWSDGTTLWVNDFADQKVYAYRMSDSVRQTDKEFDLKDGNGAGRDIWSNGTTMWVSDRDDNKLYAYRLLTGERDSSRDFNTLGRHGNTNPFGIWSDGETMWVVDISDNKAYSYNMPPPPATDATLSALNVSPRDIIGFDDERDSYEVGVAHDVDQATIMPTTTHALAYVSISPEDADEIAGGHQVALSAGKNAVTVTVTAEDDMTTETYTVNVNRGVSDIFGWNAGKDLDGLKAAGNTNPVGFWSDGTTAWVGDDDDNKLYAYNLADGTRDSARDFNTLNGAGNTNPQGIWSDGNTMWVADFEDEKIYAYHMSSRQRNTAEDFDSVELPEEGGPVDIWSNGTTMWAVFFTPTSGTNVLAYRMSNKTPDETQSYSFGTAANGMWSDGLTMWVGDVSFNPRLTAYRLSDGMREVDKDFTTLVGAENRHARQIWSDRTTMWVVDQDDDKVYSYNTPVLIDLNLGSDNTLRSLRLSPATIPSFDPGVNIYYVGVASSVNRVTVSPTTADSNATYEITPTDASGAGGHQVDLLHGPNDISIKVTAENTLMYTYRVTVYRGSSEEFERKGAGDTDLRVDGLGHAHSFTATSSAFWAASDAADTVHAFNRNGARNTGRDVDLHADNENPAGIWTDGTHLWVADSEDDKVYVYRVSGGQRQTTREWALDSANGDPSGIWSDRSTMWVSDSEDQKLYAYRLTDGNRQSNRDIEADHPVHGIWSDGAVMWVSDPEARKLYAYNLQSGQRHPELDFNTPAADDGHAPHAIWGDANTMWMTDLATGQAYAYNMPGKNFLQRPSTPRLPRDFTLSSKKGSDTVRVDWSDQYSDPRAPITGYQVRYRQEGTSRWTTISRQANDLSTSQQIGVTDLHLYEVELAAQNRLGSSERANGKIVYHPAQSWPADDPNPSSIDIGPLGAYWTNSYGSFGHHPERNPLNPNSIHTSCTGNEPFTILWNEINDAPANVEAHFITSGGVWRISYETTRARYAGEGRQYRIFGTADMHGETNFSFRVRMRRSGENWSRWSDIASLFCDTSPKPEASQGQQGNEGQGAPQPNSPATGEPVIWSGTLAVGEMLVALTQSVNDANGMDNAVLAYQWLRNPGTGDEEIPGATSVRYTITEDDLNSQLSVRVTFTDDSGNEETLTSLSVVIRPPSPLYGGFDAGTVPASHDGGAAFDFQIHFSEEPALTRSRVRDHVLTVTNGDVTAAEQTLHDGERSNIRWTITLQPDGDEDVTVTMGPTTDCDDQSAVCTSEGQMLTNRSHITVPGPEPTGEPTGLPTITGTLQVDQTLTADISGISDSDGLENASFSYQWLADDTAIEGATGSTYTLAESDADKTIRVRVSFTDDGGNDETLTSAATAAVEPAYETQTSEQTSSGPLTGFSLLDAAASDQTLLDTLAEGSAIQVADPNGGSYAIRADVQSGSSIGSVVMELTGAKNATRTENFSPYSLYGDEGNNDLHGANLPVGSYTLQATAYSESRGNGDELGTLEISFTVAAAETPAANRPAAGKPAITGVADLGRTLTADTSGINDADGLDNASFSYQWLRDGDDINGATGSTYTAVEDDVSASISVRVSFTDDEGHDESLTSDSVAIPLPLTAEITATYPYDDPEETVTEHPGHDGSNTFVVYLVMSVNVSVGFANVRDHVLDVTGGEVETAKRFDRDAADKNRVWTITIQPSGNDDVVIALAPTTDCGDDSAICTSTGRWQSSEVEYIVAGP